MIYMAEQEARKFITEHSKKKTRSEYIINSDGSGIRISDGVKTEYERMKHVSEKSYQELERESDLSLKVGAVDRIFRLEELRENEGGRIIYYDSKRKNFLGISNPVSNVEPPYKKEKSPIKTAQAQQASAKSVSQPPRRPPLGKIVVGMQEQYDKEGQENAENNK